MEGPRRRREQSRSLNHVRGRTPTNTHRLHALTGEPDVKEILKRDYADVAVLSADYFAVPETDIPHIESVPTVIGGRIGHTAAEYGGLEAPLRPVSPE